MIPSDVVIGTTIQLCFSNDLVVFLCEPFEWI